jgi:hypothetical protein
LRQWDEKGAFSVAINQAIQNPFKEMQGAVGSERTLFDDIDMASRREGDFDSGRTSGFSDE